MADTEEPLVVFTLLLGVVTLDAVSRESSLLSAAWTVG